MRIRSVMMLACLAMAGLASAETVSRSFRAQQKFVLDPKGLFVIENPVGDVIVEGRDVAEVRADIVKNVSGATAAAVEEGRRHSAVIVGGDNRTRIVRASVPSTARGGWTASMSWHVFLPRTASVRVITQSSRRISISGLQGHVHVKNFSGSVILNGNVGPVVVESVNGSIVYRNPKPRANVTLTSVNGDVTAAVAPEADIRWVAETLNGDVTTNLAPRGAFVGPAFRATLNAPGGPTIITSTLMGSVHLLAHGRAPHTAQSIRRAGTTLATTSSPQSAPNGKGIVRPVVTKSFRWMTNLGDVRVQEIRGDADIYTGAGEVQLGAVAGSCKVQSLGGPLQLGEILGPLNASTRAGDIFVDSARRGGSIRTQGGTIRLLYTSGATELYSGGGDIHVAQAAAPITAGTRSGDISIRVDPSSKSETISATTARGSIVLNVNTQFGATIDATVITDDPDGDTIESDLPGLSISREQFEGKTRVRATGRINGGGERVVLRATDGDIRITTRAVTPTVVRRR